MKKSLLGLILTSFAMANSFAQQSLVFQSTDVPTAPWNQRIAIDTLPLPAINFGSKGANQTYNFSNLSVFRYDTVEHRVPTQTQANKFLGTDDALTSNGRDFLYSDKSTTNLVWVGLEGDLLPGLYTDIQFNPKPEVYRFPTQYGGNFAGSYGFTKIVSGSDVGQPLVGNVRVVVTANYTDTIDGWGKVITPVGTYKCLRVKRVEQTRTKIDASTIFSPNNYNQAVRDTRDTTTRYQYLTKEAKGSVITFNYDTFDQVTSVSWSMIPPDAPVAGFTYGVGANGQVTFTDTSGGYPTSWSWNFGDNTATSSQQNPNHTYTANGSYYVCLTATNAGGSTTKCDTVKVTTIAALNQKPIAKNDSTTCVQGDSVSLNPLTNDSDPDFNTLSVTNTYNAQNGTVTRTGNTVKYKPNAPFTGWDYFDYRICDNGSPILCDTGRIYVQVTPKPVNQKPIARDDSTTCQQPDSITINVMSNDSDPDQNSFSVSGVFNFQNGSATTNGVTVVYKPNAQYSGWDYFDYRICDNGSPVQCDTARVYVNVFPEIVAPVLPVANFNYFKSSSGSCGFTFENASTNADSIIWKFYSLGGVGLQDTTFDSDTVIYNKGSYFNYKVCLHAFNQDGMDSICIDLTEVCSGINETDKVQVAVYPNPAQNEVYIQYETTETVKAVRLYDIAGRLVKETPAIANNKHIAINTTDVQNGNYFIEVMLQNNVVGGRSRLLIQK